MKIKFQRLDYQKIAVDSISEVFENISFTPNQNNLSNPNFDINSQKLSENIKKIREKNAVSTGVVEVKDDLNIDILMETGTGKTFTFLESIYRLNKDYRLSKFIILVPSNPIRQGTIKNINITKEFFLKEYNKHISVFDYNEKTITNYINASNQNISVLISTYQAFNKASNNINKNKIERHLFSNAKSYMQAIAELRPVVIIDEPHRFEGRQTTKYLKNFNALFTLRFGATFKDDEYRNLIYTLDSATAFNKGLVKAISVDSVGSINANDHSLSFVELKGSSVKNYEAKIEYTDINLKEQKIWLKKGDNLGKKSNIEILNSYVVEKITKTEVIFSNGISLAFGESESYGILLDDIQKNIINTAIKNHFEREEELFKLGIKSLSLFFIDRVDKYLGVDGSKDGDIAKSFEELYKQNLSEILNKPNLDEKYKDYLLKTKNSLKEIHSGYFAKSNKDGDEAEAIELILSKKEELLSFDSDLRFIFSQWALQEGWDNPNIMTLCKLSPSNSKISKLQQIGRGLRLAVDKNGNRITKENENFDFINELFVVVPLSEEDFVSSIQNDIRSSSITTISRVFDEDILVKNNIANTSRAATKLIDELENKGFVKVNDDDKSEIIISKDDYFKRCDELKKMSVKNCDFLKLKEYFDGFFNVANKIKAKNRNLQKDKIKINKTNFKKFKDLWDSLHYEALIKYDVNSDELIKNAIKSINENFTLLNQEIIIQSYKQIQDLLKQSKETTSLSVDTSGIFSAYEFVKALCDNTKLSLNTICKILKGISKEKFELIKSNENLALKKLQNIIIDEIYNLVVDKISYDIKEIKTCNTSLTDEKGNVKDFIYKGMLGKELYKFLNTNVKNKSIYDENFMEVDSEIEKETIDESSEQKIIVFGKLPRVNIPTIHGKKYNPDFGYVIEKDNQKELFLIVETKGYDNIKEIPESESLKIKSVKKFFEALRGNGINIEFKTKINKENLSSIINKITQKGP